MSRSNSALSAGRGRIPKPHLDFVVDGKRGSGLQGYSDSVSDGTAVRDAGILPAPDLEHQMCVSMHARRMYLQNFP